MLSRDTLSKNFAKDDSGVSICCNTKARPLSVLATVVRTEILAKIVAVKAKYSWLSISKVNCG